MEPSHKTKKTGTYRGDPLILEGLKGSEATIFFFKEKLMKDDIF